MATTLLALQDTATIYTNAETARKIARANNLSDADWTYYTEELPNGYAKVYVRDEDGNEIGYL
jgi:hypothetical protein